MKNRQSRLWNGSLAALAQALAYILFLALVLGLLPTTGGFALSDYSNPAMMLRKAALHPQVEPLLLSLDLLSVAFSLLPVFIMVALVQRIDQITATQRRLILGFISVNAALFLAAAAIDSGGQPMFLQLYSAGQTADAIAGYRVVGLINLQLGNAAAFAYGLSILLVSWATWRAQAFSRAFLILSFIWGLIAVLSWPFIVIGAIGPVIGVVWCVWLGILLWSGVKLDAFQGDSPERQEEISPATGESQR